MTQVRGDLGIPEKSDDEAGEVDAGSLPVPLRPR